MDIILNGKTHVLEERAPLNYLVNQLQLTDKAIAVAVNQVIIPKSEWPVYTLQAQDHVDIVQAIGGG